MTANIEVNTENKFLPSSDELPQVYLLYGMHGAGKSCMLKSVMHIFENRKQFSWGITFAEPDEYTWMPSQSVHIYDNEYFQNYINNLRQIQKHGQRKMPPNFVIFDDNNGTLAQNEFILNFLSTHRQTNTTIFMLTSAMAVPTSAIWRVNTTCTIVVPTFPEGFQLKF